jgi:hypothetical protein
MGKGAKPPTPTAPPPPVVAESLAGRGDSLILKKKAAEKGMNYEDTLLAGASTSLGRNTILGNQQ